MSESIVFHSVLLIVLIVLGSLLGLAVLYLLWLAVSSLFITQKKQYDTPSPYYRFMIDLTCRLSCFLSGVRVEVEGRELLPKDSLYLLVSNHRSVYDPLVLLAELRDQKLIFVSKPENFRIPVVGTVIHRCCFMAIDRDNPRNAVTTIRRASDLIQAGVGPVVIYPEGTRTKTGELLPFHNAVFKIAQNAKVPVVVSTITGTELVRSRMPFRRTKVKVKILEVLPADAVCAVKTNVIGDQVREIMEHSLS